MDESQSAVSGAAFREAMSRVAGHVTIVSTSGPAGIGGVTVTAVASVSDSPPSMLLCLNASSRTLQQIHQNGRFCVNALAASHEEVARVFSGEGGLSGAQRFRHGDGWIMDGHAPRLAGALSAIECDVSDTTPVGTHVVLIGRVVAAHAGAEMPPLMYHRRQYWGA
ncbi:MAG: flavin reductase family protein [Beijerinckiaceae bacterium]